MVEDRSRADGDAPPGVPRWVKLSGIAVLTLILLVVVFKLTGVLDRGHGPGRHGPGQHSSSDVPRAARPALNG